LNALHGNNWRNSAISGEGAVADPWGWRSVWLLWKWSTHNVTTVVPRRAGATSCDSSSEQILQSLAAAVPSPPSTHTHARTQCGQAGRRGFIPLASAGYRNDETTGTTSIAYCDCCNIEIGQWLHSGPIYSTVPLDILIDWLTASDIASESSDLLYSL